MLRSCYRGGRAPAAATAILLLLVSTAFANRDGEWSVLDVGAGDRPDPRKHHTMVYDPVNNWVILYGGENQDIDSEEPFSDLWILHLDGSPYWEEVTDACGSPPPGMHGHVAAYDADEERMFVLTGRNDFGTPSASSFVDGVWALSPGDTMVWDSLFAFPSTEFKACASDPSSCERPFSNRNHSAAACLSDGLYIMGGRAGTGALAMHDVWKHQFGGGPNWSYVSGSLTGIASFCESCIEITIPNLRYWHTMIADGEERLVVFGGVYEETAVSNAFVSDDGGDTWEFLGRVPTSPVNFSREFHAAVYDSEDERMVVVGGYIRTGGGATVTGSVTSLPLPATLPDLDAPDDVNDDWVLHETCGDDPGPMAEHAAVYDSAADRIIVFGGVTTGDSLRSDDVWVLQFTDDVTAPATVTLSAGLVGKYGSTITWTAPGDDGSTGTASAYDLRRSSSVITEGNFESATPLSTDPPQSAGNSECASTGPVSPCGTYYYALKTIDNECNVSAMSNVLSMTQNCSGASYVCGGLGPVSAQLLPRGLEYKVRSANPASDVTTLFVGVPPELTEETMNVVVYDVTGARVRTLAAGPVPAGEHELRWDHRSDAGTTVAGGVYFVRLTIGNEVQTRKIVIPVGR